MRTQTTSAIPRANIEVLEAQLRRDNEMVRQSVNQLLEFAKPSKIFQRIVRDTATDKNIKGKVIVAAAGISSEIIVRKLSLHNPKGFFPKLHCGEYNFCSLD